jgi:hypothetical protein
MEGTMTVSLSYWQWTFCHQPKVEWSFSRSELVADSIQLALYTCLKVVKIHKFARSTVLLWICITAEAPKGFADGFLRKCSLHINRGVLGGSSPHSPLGMCSCGQTMAERMPGMRKKSLFRTEVERSCWRGKRTWWHRASLCASHCARHIC